MHRIDGAGHVDHLFVAEDPATLRPPTEITPEIMNAFQEELATFIEWAGIALAKGDNTQLKQALVAKFAGLDAAATKSGVQGQIYTAFTTAGATGAFTLTPVPAIAGYAAGQRFRVKFHAAGNGADTVNVSGLGVKSLKQYNNAGEKIPAVIAANQLVDVEYDGVDMVLLDPLPQFGNAAGSKNLGASANLLASDAGKEIVISGTGGVVATLPLIASVPIGAMFYFTNIGSGVSSVARQGADQIDKGGATATAVSLGIGDSLIIVSNGAYWNLVGGSAQLSYAAVFGSSLAANGYQKLPSGLIIQWGESSSSVATGVNSQLSVSFPIAFPTACLSVMPGGRDTAVASAYSNSAVKLYTKSTTGAVLLVDTFGAGGEGATYADYIALGY